jgi:hypothetical protein
MISIAAARWPASWERFHISRRRHSLFTLESTFDQITEMFLERYPELTSEQAHARAVSLYRHMVGTILLSRSASASKPALADEILGHGRSSIFADLSLPHSLENHGTRQIKNWQGRGSRRPLNHPRKLRAVLPLTRQERTPKSDGTAPRKNQA